ncbi:MAG: ABC transporter permease [Solirubrobacterales bacterium]
MSIDMRDIGRALSRVAITLSGIALGIFIWWLVIEIFDIAPYVVAPPEAVWDSLVEDRSILLENALPTAYEALLGFAIGNIMAIFIAVIFVHNQTIERGFFPVAVFVQTLPLVAVAPVLVLAFGTGMTSKVIIAALMTLFPTLVNMVRGLKAISPQTEELFRVSSATRSNLFWKARTYASLPFLFTSLKIASTSAVIGAIVAEWVGADEGIGYLIITATYNFQTALLYSTMIVGALLAITLFSIVTILEKIFITWDTGE